MFCSTRSRCCIPCLRSGAICFHLGSTSLLTWSRCSGFIFCQTCALSRNSCCCGGGSCLNRFSSRCNLCRSSGVNSRGRTAAFGERFLLKFGRCTDSPVALGGRFPPSREFPDPRRGFAAAGLRGASALRRGASAFRRSGCALCCSCCCCRRSCLGSCLRCWFCCCLCSFGGLFSWPLCAQFVRGFCAAHSNAIPAPTTSVSNHPPDWSRTFIAPYIS